MKDNNVHEYHHKGLNSEVFTYWLIWTVISVSSIGPISDGRAQYVVSKSSSSFLVGKYN